jgi:hypothetical protein
MTRVRQIWTFWAYGWTNPEVTRVTTGRVTRGTDDVSKLRDRDDIQMMTWQVTGHTEADVASDVDQLLVDTWHRLVKCKVPHGPIKGCHVAPRYWLMVLFKICGGPWGFEPGPPHRATP